MKNFGSKIKRLFKYTSFLVFALFFSLIGQHFTDRVSWHEGKWVSRDRDKNKALADVGHGGGTDGNADGVSGNPANDTFDGSVDSDGGGADGSVDGDGSS